MTGNWRDKDGQYKGSQRMFYSGADVGSTTGFNYIGFSGTNTKFGSDGSENSSRFMIVGSNSSVVEWSWDGTNVAGKVYGTNNAVVMDGVFRSGVHVRADAASQHVRIWAW